MKKNASLTILGIISIGLLYLGSCTREKADPCKDAFLISNIEINNPYKGVTNGRIFVTVSPDTGGAVIYKLNNGPDATGNTFTGLAAGKYTITAKSPSGCVSTREVDIAEVEACSQEKFDVGVAAPKHPTSPFSNDGSIRGSATGDVTGLTFKLLKANGPTASSPGGVFDNLGGGQYTLIASNSFGCTDTTNIQLIPGDPCPNRPITLAVSSITPWTPCEGTVNTGEIRLLLSGSPVPPFTFTIVGPSTNRVFTTNTLSCVFSNLGQGAYTVSARDRDACIRSQTGVTVPRRDPGNYFAATKAIVTSSTCGATNNACHSAAAKGPRFTTDDCVIVTNEKGIYARAQGRLANHSGLLHLLSQSQSQTFVNWHNAGGRYPN